MLQWMGGSRRKVTTSRKSTHKSSNQYRQKQYFEQRKRQQQQLQTAGLESYADGKRSCTLHCENNRSLDILSLVNVSTVAQEHKTSCTNGRDNSEDDDFTLNHQYTHPSLAILTNEGIPVDQSELNEERTPSSYGTEAEYSKRFIDSEGHLTATVHRVSVHLPDHNEDLVGNGNKLDPFKLSTMHQISFINLIGDGGANSSGEEKSVHAQEAHVAFSVEGLGKVETETPVHSPKMPDRSFPNGFSTPKKARRQPITSKHLDYGFHDMGSRVDFMTQDIGFSSYDSSIEQPFCSRDMMNIIGDPNQMSLSFRKSSPLNWNGSNLQGAFGNELIYNIRDTGRNIRNGPSFLDNSIDDLGEYESFCKNWVDQRNVDYDDYFHNKDFWKQDLNFEGWNLPKKSSSTRRTENYDMRESPVPYPKHQITEDIPDIIISDTRWYSPIGIDNDFKDAVNRFVREDTRESLSLLSEESCSSTAVRGDATKKSRETEHQKNPEYNHTQI